MIFHHQSASESHCIIFVWYLLLFCGVRKTDSCKESMLLSAVAKSPVGTSNCTLTVHMKAGALIESSVGPNFGPEWKGANEEFSVTECVRYGPRPLHASAWPHACTCWNDIQAGLLTYAYLLLKYSFWIGITDKIGISFLICIQISTACLLTCSHHWALNNSSDYNNVSPFGCVCH